MLCLSLSLHACSVVGQTEAKVRQEQNMTELQMGLKTVILDRESLNEVDKMTAGLARAQAQ